jgi:hypothetical protein
MPRRLDHGLRHARGRRELVVFAVVYLLYDASRWVFAGRVSTADMHARWVIDECRVRGRLAAIIARLEPVGTA